MLPESVECANECAQINPSYKTEARKEGKSHKEPIGKPRSNARNCCFKNL